jgi:molybdopterin molybdotransferase
MIQVEEAECLVKAHLPDWGKELLSIDGKAIGYLGGNFYSDRNYPPYHRVMMDGIAVNYEVFFSGQRNFFIEDISPAGVKRKSLKNQMNAIEVMTGCPLPEGCNLVIPYEDVKIDNSIANVITESKRSLFDNIHAEGSDVKEGEIIALEGDPINGPLAGIAASIGISSAYFKRTPRILIISTGNELVDISVTPDDYQIRKSNSYALKKSLGLYGFDKCDLDHLEDDTEILSSHFNQAIHQYDLLIYSGGVSKGKFDFLPEVWIKNNVKKIFHGVAQKPGKPLWFGKHEESNTLIMGLPGNPVSSLVCLHRYFLNSNPIFVIIEEEIKSSKNLTLFQPVKLRSEKDGRLYARPIKIKNSGEFSALRGSDGFIEIPKGRDIFNEGDVFQFFSWRPLL